MSSHISAVGLEIQENFEEYHLPSWRNVNNQAMHNHGNVDRSKKRDLDDFLATSSDPPLFSSDDVPSAAENYAQPRSKRQRKGPWWSGSQEMQSSHRRKRGGFTRNIDSAVWMGSDATEEDSIDSDGTPTEVISCDQEVVDTAKPMEDESAAPSRSEPSQEDGCFELAMKYIEDPGLRSGPVFPYWIQQPDDLEAYHDAQILASITVEQVVETCHKELDLSSLSLKLVQSLTLRPLRYLTRPLRHDTRRSHRPVSEAYFEELAQPLELTLSHNQLEEIPEEVYNLTNLKFLSVRANDITEILPSISRLRRMTTLGVGGNKLRWLPAELIGLMSTNLSQVTTHGNPFINPILSAERALKERDFTFPSWSDMPVCRFRSETAYLNIDGTCIPGWAPAPSQVAESVPSQNANDQRPTFVGPAAEEKNHTPSLFELSLRACYHAPNLAQLPYLLPSTCPPSIPRLLKHAWRVNVAGGMQCSICAKSYLIPRTEWMEWWHCPQIPSSTWHGNPPIPFIKRGCSWACAPNQTDGTGSEVIGWTNPE